MLKFGLILAFLFSIICSVYGSCLNGEFFCIHSNQCIPSQLRCDRNTDCRFGEDEQGCSCELLCNDPPRCILKAEICDGESQCDDKSDETNCTEIRCHHDQFGCPVSGTSKCLSISLRCDLNRDCDDGSDEEFCGTTTTSKPSPSCQRSADGYLDSCPQSSLLASTFRLEMPATVRHCDTIPDCPLGEDEKNCVGKINCSSDGSLFTCANGRECVRSDNVCDGFSQCSDSSDEFAINCLKKYGEDPEAYRLGDKCPFQCEVPQLTAESQQEKSILNLPYWEFCISTEQVCDGTPDCPLRDDESALQGCPSKDEFRLARQTCGDGSSRDCDQKTADCIDTPATGPECICKPGFRPVSWSRRHCTDIDECALGACEHSCENLDGSFACGCREGYSLSPTDCQRCVASDIEEEPFFIFSTPKNIYRIDKPSQMGRINLYHAVSGQMRSASCGAIPFDYARLDELLIFYDNSAIKAIWGISVMEPSLFLSVDHDVTWLAYDDLNNNVYYNNGNQESGGYFWRVFFVGILREKARVTMASRSSGFKTLVRNYTSGASASNLVLYPEMGLMFFTTYYRPDKHSRVMSCALNGDDLREVPGSFSRIVSLSIDRSAGYLYILDVGRPGLAQLHIVTKSSPATLGELIWLEERRSFFGPNPFVAFASGEFDSKFYFLIGELSDDGEFDTSFHTFNKSSTMAVLTDQTSPAAAPFLFISSGSLLSNTSIVRVRSVARPLQLDVCFHERQHRCDVQHICLGRPPPPGKTDAFTLAVCECPDDASDCSRLELSIRPGYMPPGRPVAPVDEFKSRKDCENMVLDRVKHRNRKGYDVVGENNFGATDIDLLDFGNWPTNLTGSFDDDVAAFSMLSYDALVAEKSHTSDAKSISLTSHSVVAMATALSSLSIAIELHV